MIPKAKKNLHACEYHLKNLLNSTHFEEVEINFAAFVISARATTFVLQKEFKKKPKFKEWYGDPDKPEEVKEGTKLYQMKNDELCSFFHNLRNKIEKEGITNLNCSTTIKSLDTAKDILNKPVHANITIGSTGIYFHVEKGTPQEDMLPAKTKGKVKTSVNIKDAPLRHLDKVIANPNIIVLSRLYYDYLKNLVEEWTGIINSLV